MEKWQEQIEEILREHSLDDEPSQWKKMTEELIELTRKVHAPSGAMGVFVVQVLNKLTDRKVSRLVTAHTGFRLGVAYERYQNANRGVK